MDCLSEAEKAHGLAGTGSLTEPFTPIRRITAPSQGAPQSWGFDLLRPGDAQLDHAIEDAHAIRRNIDNCRHLKDGTGPDIKLGAVTGTRYRKTLEITFADWTIIVRAQIGNGKQLSSDVEDDDRTSICVQEQPFAGRKLTRRSDIDVLQLRSI